MELKLFLNQDINVRLLRNLYVQYKLNINSESQNNKQWNFSKKVHLLE